MHAFVFLCQWLFIPKINFSNNLTFLIVIFSNNFFLCLEYARVGPNLNSVLLILGDTRDICDAMHERVPNGENGVISTVVQRTCKGIKLNKIL